MSADIYSLGRIMERMLAHRRYRGIIRECLQADPRKRPSAADVARALRQKSGRHVASRLLVAAVAALCALSCALYFYRPEPLVIEVPGRPSESAIKAVWDKVVKDIDRQIEFCVTYDFPHPEEHENDVEELIPIWEEHLYYSFLEIGCTEDEAAAKSSELGPYMRRRAAEMRAAKGAGQSD